MGGGGVLCHCRGRGWVGVRWGFSWRGPRPQVQEALVHAPWAELVHFPQDTEDAEFSVRHAHVCFVGLDVGFCDGFEFGGWHCVEELLEDGETEVVTCPAYEHLEIGFGDAAYGVDVGRAAVVFGQVAAEGFVDVCGSQDEEAAAAPTLTDSR